MGLSYTIPFLHKHLHQFVPAANGRFVRVGTDWSCSFACAPGRICVRILSVLSEFGTDPVGFCALL